MHDWKDTRLWQALGTSASPEKDKVQAFLLLWMEQIQQVLASGGTSPLDFTLHDADHSFRVAEWMADIVPSDVLGELSAYELALLLLSAYLHDIGMTPEQEKVQQHWRHLVFGLSEKDGLTEKEAADFQRWLDDERDGLVPPLARDGHIGEEDFRRAAEIITYYARHKHNDWSEEWIRQNASKASLGSYEGWVDDLVRVCRSHHYGYDELVKPSFDPRPAGRKGEVVHLRYIACVLRIADILDVDPERTPDVLFHHRAIAAKSVIYWWKDHEFWIRRDDSALVLHARPRSAVIEKAVHDTVFWIREELGTCARLSREKPFGYASFQASKPLPHRWDFPESLVLQVRPANDEYVYIDGAFRPNTAKLLELLSGIQLYKDPLAAVRELLQNAFDAVKEQIALERLALDDPSDQKRAEAITALQNVELRFEERDGRFWLVCTDTGVGMTRRIIEKYLLVSGSGRRHDVLDLERRCEAAGFRLGRTGQFGIGVLSYFMLADRVEIRTRRSHLRGDTEQHGWQFESNGVGSFGELRKSSREKSGTTVRLRLKVEAISGWEEFMARLLTFVGENILRVPCKCVFGDERRTLSFEPGWVTLNRDVVRDDVEWLQHEWGDERWVRKKLYEEMVERFHAAIRWVVKEGELPSKLGHYRMAVPIFELPGGRCGFFIGVEHTDASAFEGFKEELFPHGDAIGLVPRIRTSFQGVITRSKGLTIRDLSDPVNDWESSLVDVDWEDIRSGRMSVDRGIFEISPEAICDFAWLRRQVRCLQVEALSEGSSVYADLNARMINESAPRPTEGRWLMVDKGKRVWGAIPFPSVEKSSLGRLRWKKPLIKWGEKPLSVTNEIRVQSRVRVSELNWGSGFGSRYFPDRILVLSMSPLFLVPIFTRAQVVGGSRLRLVDFPSSWSILCGFLTDKHLDPPLWNRAHPFIGSVKEEELLRIADEVVSYVAIDKEIFGLKTPGEIAFWAQSRDIGSLLILRPEGPERILATDPRIHDYLPDPGPEWKLTITYEDEGEPPAIS